MKHLTLATLFTSTLLLAACVDTTGISATLSRPPKGNANAMVRVQEFADLECPACMAAHSGINKPITEKYGQSIRFDFVHFPLRNIHRFALDLAEASECAADQGKFWEFIDIAYQKQPELKKGVISDWATALQLDMDLFDRCTKSHIKRDAILAEYDMGVKAGVQGTPTYFVNGQRVASTTDDLVKAIDAALAVGGPKL